jgi:hypothetical protein
MWNCLQPYIVVLSFSQLRPKLVDICNSTLSLQVVVAFFEVSDDFFVSVEMGIRRGVDVRGRNAHIEL